MLIIMLSQRNVFYFIYTIFSMGYTLSYSSKNIEDYLKAIYKLEEVFGLAKTGDIAKELGVTAATVSKTLKRLEASKLIEWLPYEGVKLSAKGKAIAITIIKRHRLAEYFLYYYLKFDLIKAHTYAHMLEHMPEDFFDKLWTFMNKPGRCPHGNIIPGLPEYREEDLQEIANDDPLPRLGERAQVRVTRILCSFQHKLINQLIKAGINIGSIISIEKTSDYSVVIKNPNSNAVLEVPLYQASFIRGVPLSEKVKQVPAP